MAAATAEDEFMRVLDEMNKLCGEENSDNEEDGGGDPILNQTAASSPSASPTRLNSLNNNVDSGDENSKSDGLGDRCRRERDRDTDPELLDGHHHPSGFVDPENEENSSAEAVISGDISPFAVLDETCDNSISATTPLIGDQLLSSTSSKIKKCSSMSNLANNKSGDSLNGNPGGIKGSGSRSRHGSANSAKSCVSFDSAIGDVYSVQTPTKTDAPSSSTTSNSSASSAKGSSGMSDLEFFDFPSSKPNEDSDQNADDNGPTPSAGLQFDNLAASVVLDSGLTFDTVVDFEANVEEVSGISMRLVGSEDVELVGSSFSLNFDDPSVSEAVATSSTVTATSENMNPGTPPDLDPVVTIVNQQDDLGQQSRYHSQPPKEQQLYQQSISNRPGRPPKRKYSNDDWEFASPSSSAASPSQKNKKAKMYSHTASQFGPGRPPNATSTPKGKSGQPHHQPPAPTYGHAMVQHRQEVEMICIDLLNRFQHAAKLHPRTQARAWMVKSGSDDPLLVTTRLLGDSLTRMRIFLFNLDPMNWLTFPDRDVLYNSNVCAMAIMKASVGLNLETVPSAYPLPYGEYLGEVEALHLILAHDLYNELRTLLSHIQNLGIREFPVMLLLMMVTFFSPMPSLRQPDRVIRVHDYYMHKLQIYLSLRFGPDHMGSLMTSLMATIDKVRHFSTRLREFLCDVTRCGLQKQFESVCENIGLIAFLLQTEPRYEMT